MYRIIVLSITLIFSIISPSQALQLDKNGQALTEILSAQDEKAQARFEYRRPLDTLSFFGIKPGMNVVEALPGGGWYSKILLPYIGSEGSLVGLDYNLEMWPNFGFVDAEFLDKRKNWVETWSADAQGWRGENGASVSAATFGTVPEADLGSKDAILFIRALHNLARFESKGGYLTSALADAYALLKPGGTVGIVQHQAREDRPDEWANGSNGYLKKSFIKAEMAKAGFVFVDESAHNENAKDQAGEGDIVWRLPPSYAGSKDKPELKQKMTDIGESNRMTLLFEKPIE